MTVRISVRMRVILESYIFRQIRGVHISLELPTNPASYTFTIRFESCTIDNISIFVRAKYPDTKRGMCGKIRDTVSSFESSIITAYVITRLLYHLYYTHVRMVLLYLSIRLSIIIPKCACVCVFVHVLFENG